MKKQWLVVGLIGCISMTAYSQSHEEDGIAALAHMEGTWRVTAYERAADGAWHPGTPTTATIESLLDGNGWAEHVEVRGPNIGFTLYTVFTYDVFRKVYRSMTLDANEGLMDVYEGALVDGTLTLTNEKAETWFITDSGAALKFKLEYVLTSPDAHTLNVAFAAVNTSAWQPMMRIEYERMLP